MAANVEVIPVSAVDLPFIPKAAALLVSGRGVEI